MKIKPKTSIMTSVRRTMVFLSVIALSAGSFGAVHFVGAQSLQDQINDLNRQNSATRAQINTLELEAENYEEMIEALGRQIVEYERQIAERQAESEKIQDEIDLQQKELDKQKDLLGQNIRAMYLEGDITTIEMLATSKSLSEFFDKQQYQESVKNKIKKSLDTITTLKAELSAKRAEVEKIIKQQEELKLQADAQRVEQDRLLTYNRAQQTAYNTQIKENQKRINELKVEQAVENARLFGGNGGTIGGGGYPWGYAACFYTGQVDGPCDNYDWRVDNSTWNWSTGGYAFRNCTDWASWRVRAAGGYVPAGLGNAKTWDDRGPSYGFTVSSTPRAGSVAVSNNGYYGHVMYVESVNSNGSIVISDYNRAGTGKYEVNTLSASVAANLRYVYF